MKLSRLDKIIIFWGLCDISQFAGYLIKTIAHRQIPIISGLLNLFRGTPSLGTSITQILGLAMFISVAFSGYFLVTRKKIAAVISYVQAPFRILFGVSSLGIVYVAMLHFFPTFTSKPAQLIFGIMLLLVIEIVKIITIILWHKKNI